MKAERVISATLETGRDLLPADTDEQSEKFTTVPTNDVEKVSGIIEVIAFDGEIMVVVCDIASDMYLVRFSNVTIRPLEETPSCDEVNGDVKSIAVPSAVNDGETEKTEKGDLVNFSERLSKIERDETNADFVPV